MNEVTSVSSGSPAEAESRPAAALFEGIVGQPEAVGALRAAARRPVHAYLLVGPAPATLRAARSFAAALLCPDGGCAVCEHCRRALAGTHPDLTTVERTGAAVGIDEARRVTSLAARRPLEAARQVLVVADVHLAVRSAPALLKTVEEPPPTTVFVLLAEQLPPELATVASRCVVVRLPPVPSVQIAEWLTAQGADAERAHAVARSCGGDLDRARLLADDLGYVARLDLWRSVAGRLDGTGAVAASLAKEILAAADEALGPLRARQAEELDALAEQAELAGARSGAGRKAVTERHRREERRWRTEQIRSGLGALARAYRDRLVEDVGGARVHVEGEAPVDSAGGPRRGRGDASPVRVAQRMRACEDAVALITETAASLDRNPNERLQLEALIVRLGRLDL